MCYEEQIQIDGEVHTLTVGPAKRQDGEVVIRVNLFKGEISIIQKDINKNDLSPRKLQETFSERYKEVIKLILNKGRVMEPEK